jgi:CheY-like chemotaxis protein
MSATPDFEVTQPPPAVQPTAQALDYLRDHVPALVILDPGIDGVAVLRSMRADSGLAQVPVVVYSADGQHLRADVERLGVQGWITKGIRDDQLLEVARSYACGEVTP